MPLHKTITVSEHIKSFIWKVTEKENELATGIELSQRCQDRLRDMKSEMHRRAFLSIRHLLGLAGYEGKHLFYNEFGKPFLMDGTHISISHSHNFTGIIVSTSNKVGIDIEKQREKILRIAHKFTPLHEYRTVANAEALILKLTQVWCAKEALYKIYAQPGLSFLNHIMVNDFKLGDLGTTAEIHYQGRKSSYQITFDEFEGFSYAYALDGN
ncbi:4'-phosphopantetheinyl transferase superfamily protein [Muricauda sp. SCSIO 64092]|uniref:4'-phosphopantetheinyl transferase family protein n=1 Tax=Allomuricauda sp. SCSIO 64092 TaxID=2908842 RepID=UPI001FF58230|nr:4'-phosphopantetheinyl transferase family protein [Muricauda sp. SCSIO 64092]UOY04735.1 4'-phosphopantetheinyl transferase superfamily protein [Muricauda sp. SCSIO 64092]